MEEEQVGGTTDDEGTEEPAPDTGDGGEEEA